MAFEKAFDETFFFVKLKNAFIVSLTIISQLCSTLEHLYLNSNRKFYGNFNDESFYMEILTFTRLHG